MKKKILFIVEDINFSGGLEKVVTYLANNLKQDVKLEVSILSLSNRKKRVYYIEPGVFLYNLDIPHYKSKSVFKYASLNTLAFGKFFQENNFDILVATTYSIAALIDTIETSSSKIVWEHTHFFGYCDPDTIYKGMKGLVRKKYHQFISKPTRADLYNKFDKVVILTEKDKPNWERFHNNLIVINNPLTIEKRNYSYTMKRKKQLISVGRLVDQKGFSYLIKSFSIASQSQFLDGYSLLIVGDGPERKHLQELIDNFYLTDRVKLLGFRDDVDKLLEESMIYISSSVYEGFGLVIVEAQSRGLPVIAFDCLAGPADILSDNSGILVENKNTLDLANSIVELVKNENKIEFLSKNAKDNSSRFDIDRISNEWKKLFKDLDEN